MATKKAKKTKKVVGEYYDPDDWRQDKARSAQWLRQATSKTKRSPEKRRADMKKAAEVELKKDRARLRYEMNPITGSTGEVRTALGTAKDYWSKKLEKLLRKAAKAKAKRK
jgi:hypothetical protein